MIIAPVPVGSAEQISMPTGTLFVNLQPSQLESIEDLQELQQALTSSENANIPYASHNFATNNSFVTAKTRGKF